MKTVLFASILALSGLAQAHTVTCVQTPKSIKEDGDLGFSKIVIGVTLKKLNIQAYESQAVTITTTADLNLEDSIKNADPESPYNLDEDYNHKTELRYVSGESKLSMSDADTVIFMDKTILQGKGGKMSFSSGQANDGESGDAWLWGRDVEFDCK